MGVPNVGFGMRVELKVARGVIFPPPEMEGFFSNACLSGVLVVFI
jgi:hypothetical protein